MEGHDKAVWGLVTVVDAQGGYLGRCLNASIESCRGSVCEGHPLWWLRGRTLGIRKPRAWGATGRLRRTMASRYMHSTCSPRVSGVWQTKQIIVPRNAHFNSFLFSMCLHRELWVQFNVRLWTPRPISSTIVAITHTSLLYLYLCSNPFSSSTKLDHSKPSRVSKS